MITIKQEQEQEQQTLEDFDRKNYDFKNTYVYKVLDSSYKFKASYPSPSSIFVDAKQFLLIYCDYIRDKISSMDGDFWNLIFGYEGSGKSSLSLMVFSLLTDKNIEKILTNTIFLQNEYSKIAYYFSKNNIKKEPILIDDAHYVFGKYNTLTKETLATIQLARFFRDQQIVHICNTQSPTQLYRDIWFERINNYIYCFAIKKIYEEGVVYRLYAAAYLDDNVGDLKADMENIRDVGNWKYILANYTPSMITRFDLLFEEFSEEYSTYKTLKKFYKQFYSLLKSKGIVKGDDYELAMRLLASINRGEDVEIKDKNQLQRFVRVGILDEEKNVVDEEFLDLAKQFKDVIDLRLSVLEKFKGGR